MSTESANQSNQSIPSNEFSFHVLFVDSQLALQGDLADIALAVHALSESQQQQAIIFDAQTGIELDLDLRGDASDVAARYPKTTFPDHEGSSATDNSRETQAQPRGRGRPKLGVVGREITLLPRHWEWLDRQRGGSSAALRRLIDETRKARAGDDAARAAQLRTQRLLTTLAGNEPGFEEALRALYARDAANFERHTKELAADLKQMARRWSAPAFSV